MNKRKITWDKQALHYFRDSIRYIRKDSPQNADKVKKEILEKINELSKRPEIHILTNTRSIITGTTGLLSYTVSGSAIW
jgi:plasmid stabilization system protein ParE